MLSPALDRPGPLPCLRCGYDLIGVALDVCPECGTDAAPSLLGKDHARLVLWSQANQVWKTWAIIHIGIGLVCIVDVLGISLFYDPFTRPGAAGATVAYILFATILLSIAVALSTLAFLPLISPSHRVGAFEQRLIELIWVRHVWQLNTPWLSIPAWTAVLIALDMFASATGISLVSFCVPPCAIGWLLSSLVMFVRWFRRRQRDMAYYELASTGPRVLGTFIGASVFLGALFTGALGGVFAIVVIAR